MEKTNLKRTKHDGDKKLKATVYTLVSECSGLMYTEHYKHLALCLMSFDLGQNT